MTSATLILLLLALQGQDAEQLREKARAASEGPDRQALFLKALRLDLDRGDGCLADRIVRTDLQLTDPLREELLTLYREAVGKDGARPWVHVSMMQLYLQQGREDESLKHARVVVDLLQEGKPPLGHYDTLALFKLFATAGDLETARRLLKAVSTHAGAVEIEGELVAIEGDVEAIIQFVDRALVPRANDWTKAPNPAAKPFLEALKRERKLDAVTAKLLETPKDSDRGRFHTRILSLAMEQRSGSDRLKLLIPVLERTNPWPVDVSIRLTLLQSLAQEKKWEETRALAEVLLKRSDLIADGRAIIESALAECHEAAGEVDPAVAACLHAIEASPSRAPWVRLIQIRTLLGAKRAGPAAEACVSAFDDRLEDPINRILLEGLRKILADHRPLLPELETAACKEPGKVGSLILLSIVEELRGDRRAASDAFERAVALRPSGTLLHELFVSSVTAGRLDRAIELRGKLAAIAFGKPATGRNDPPFDIEALNKKLLETCVSAGDVGRCKRFARALASEPLGRFGQEMTLKDLLLEVLEEEFFEEIDDALVRNARDEWQRFHAHYPLAWAYVELGLGERGAAIYERLLREQEWSESSRSVGKSWIESMKEKREALTLETVRSWLAARRIGDDEVEALTKGLREGQGGSGMDRRVTFMARQPNSELGWLKLGVLLGNRLDERIEHLEELGRRGEPAPEWKVLLGIARLERGEDDRAFPVLRDVFRSTAERHRPELWDCFLRHLLGVGWRTTDLTDAARAGAREIVAEARLEFGADPAERRAAAMELAQTWNAFSAPLRGLIALGRAGSESDELRKLRATLRSGLPKDLLQALRDAELPKPSGPQEAEIRRMIQDLGNEDFDVRLAAHRNLVRIGEPAVPALLGLMDSANVDLQSHGREILRELLGE